LAAGEWDVERAFALHNFRRLRIRSERDPVADIAFLTPRMHRHLLALL